MSAYILKVVHIEDFTLNFFPLIYNNNVYPSVDNNSGDGSCTVLPAGGCLCDTVVCDNAIPRFSNSMATSIDSVLSSLHIGGKNYGIYLSKTYTVTSVTIHKMNGSICSNIFWITDDKGVTHLLRNIESTVIVYESGLSFCNNLYFMSFIPSKRMP